MAVAGPSAQRGRLRTWLLAVLLVPVVLAALAVSRSPAVAANPPPSATDVRSARQVFERVQLARQSAHKPIRIKWRELSVIAAMGGRAAGFDRVGVARDESRAHVQLSRQLPLGFWLNGHAFIGADESGAPRISGRVGHLPVPAFLVHAVIEAARGALRKQGKDVLPLNQMVKQVHVDEIGVKAVIDVAANSRMVRALGAEDIDAERVAVHYCRLNRAPRAQSAHSLAELTQQAFAAGDGSAADNRSMFIAVALMVAGVDVGALPKGKKALFDSCGKPEAEFTLQGREDLAKHWTVSAALTSFLGTDTSLALGTWKEISDSGAGGTGFSLVDLAADRAGTFAAQRGADPAQSAALQGWLAQASETNLLPVGALALAEGMTESEFRSRYTDTDSDTFAATVSRIDSVLQVQTQ